MGKGFCGDDMEWSGPCVSGETETPLLGLVSLIKEFKTDLF